MAAEVGTWSQRSLISPDLRDQLFERYDQQGTFLSGVLKWLGIFAVLQVAAAILGFVAAVAGSTLLGAVLLGTASAVAYRYGARFAADPRQRHAFTGAALVTVSLAGALGTAALLVAPANPSTQVMLALVVVNGALSVCVAYRHRLRWPLCLGLLQLFHALGSYSRYHGSGLYSLDVHDPRVMAVVALLAVVLGMWHERSVEERQLPHHAGFGGLYVKFGLTYFNLSLLILSISRSPNADMVVLFTTQCIAQIVAGALFKDGRLVGFGVVFMMINLYTRLFESLAGQLDAVQGFLLAGILALVLGGLFEGQLRRARGAAP
jgi:hypothetical protein